ncbi:putative acetyltransferase EpsM [Pelotomaculum sp. FP]|uniref:DapH/DapD/GlmU-related protein n=1 Tax=Pelotomaculum sp. FP TaxID=261474 RepID=UPI0010667D03|nr:DapH/DapD/GlmU-related protein [Pelotomaculum sp. FP]TEB14258.1 putative acetyltransferase EpsM [Pelotomaculum sp. FP]
MKKVLILGGKGNGTTIANAMVDANRRGYNEFKFYGYLNDGEEKGSFIEEYPVLDSLENIKKYFDEYYFINTILRIDGNIERINKIESLGIPNNRLVTFVHPTAYIAPNVKLYPGVVIMPNVSISSNTVIGKNSIVMVGATIGHDNEIGDYFHAAAQACVGAYLKVGKGVHIGLNSSIREHLTIGNNATIGMGTVLTKNVGENEIWIGNPCRFLRYSE